MICDAHAHLFHPRWYPVAFQEAIFRDFHRRQRRPGPGSAAGINQSLLKLLSDDTGETTVRIMDKAGISKRIILVLDWGPELGEAETGIADIHREILGICHRFGDRLIGFAGIDPRRPNATEIVAWAFDELGAKGLKLHPTGGWALTDSRTEDVVAVANDRKAPVLVHLGKTVDVLSDRNAQPEAFLKLAAKFPSIPFIAGHSGFDLWTTFLELPVTANVFFDISGWQERVRGDGGNIAADWTALHARFPGRVCFGTDSPFYSFNLPTAEKQWVDRACATPWPWAELPSALSLNNVKL